MGSTIIGQIGYPENTDATVVPTDLKDGFEQLASLGVPRFGSVAERTAAYGTLGITPATGAVCYLASAGRYETYNGSGWAALAGTLLVRHQRNTNSSATTGSAVGVLRLPGIALILGHRYKVETNSMLIDGSVTTDVARVELRYTTDGSTPTTVSPVLPGGFAQAMIANASQGPTVVVSTTYTPAAAGETLSVLLDITLTVGTGSTVIVAGVSPGILQLSVYDAGQDVTDTGFDL